MREWIYQGRYIMLVQGCCGWHVAWRYEIMVKSGASTQHAQDVVAGMFPGDMRSW